MDLLRSRITPVPMPRRPVRAFFTLVICCGVLTVVASAQNCDLVGAWEVHALTFTDPDGTVRVVEIGDPPGLKILSETHWVFAAAAGRIRPPTRPTPKPCSTTPPATMSATRSRSPAGSRATSGIKRASCPAALCSRKSIGGPTCRSLPLHRNRLPVARTDAPPVPVARATECAQTTLTSSTVEAARSMARRMSLLCKLSSGSPSLGRHCT